MNNTEELKSKIKEAEDIIAFNQTKLKELRLKSNTGEIIETIEKDGFTYFDPTVSQELFTKKYNEYTVKICPAYYSEGFYWIAVNNLDPGDEWVSEDYHTLEECYDNFKKSENNIVIKRLQLSYEISEPLIYVTNQLENSVDYLIETLSFKDFTIKLV